MLYPVESGGDIKMQTVGTVSNYTGITERTIQYYDILKVLSLHRHNGIRILFEKDLNALLKIMTLKMLNTKVTTIKKTNLAELDFKEILISLEQLGHHLNEVMICLEKLQEEKSEEGLLTALRIVNEFINLYVNKR
ncbi:MerR family transcriptional regulator [Paenibacillus albiflavus]|uniref:MerR family transcriptional regulator n=2 Tax=Paenibacillus albiflavus TaxID=2545760 RepID=A0A4R4E1J8_9BACL|nr:MerR family transcriptional regulator [Paenibacillus albiflavus]